MKKILITIFVFTSLLIILLILFFSPKEEQSKIVLKDYLSKSVPKVLAASASAQFTVNPPAGGLDYKDLKNKSLIKLLNSDGQDSSKFFDIDLRTNNEDSVNVKVTPIGSRFKPGKYTIITSLPTSQGIKDLSQDFYWGVLAINTNKSIYLPNEQAYIQMGVLDDFGNTICNAELKLKITNQELGIDKILTTQDGSIIKNSKCGVNNVIDTPDYYARYNLTKPGIYQMELIAKTRNGERSLKDFIEVRDYLPFEVERIGPTRIWPQAIYEMKFIIKANEDYQGFINERLPQSFLVYNSDGEVHSVNGFLSEITWPVNFKKGESYKFSYKFDAPNISPEFYLLGPLTMGMRSYRDNEEIFWQESRQWQIANDTTTGFIDPTSNGTSSNFNSPTNAFVSDNAYAAGGDTYILDVDNFGFSLSSGSTIDGIEVRIEWRVNSGTYNLSCQLLDATGSAIGNTKTTADTSSTSDIVDTLGSTTDMWGTTLNQSDIEDVDFGVRCTAHKVSGILTSVAAVDNIDIQITYTAGSTNNTPTITSVTDSPDPVAAGDKIYFNIDWNDADSGEMVKAHICKTNAMASASCTGGSWCDSSVFTNRDPETKCIYQTALTDASTTAYSYYAFICDDEDACSSSTSGTFTVEEKDPTAPTILLTENLPDPVNIADITPEFSAIYNDPNLGDTANKYCIQVNTISDFSGTDMWISDSSSCSSGSTMTDTIQGNRSPDFTYAGTSLSLNNTDYYWRMWFWDDSGNKSATSSVNSFTMANGGTGVRVQSGRMQGGRFK